MFIACMMFFLLDEENNAPIMIRDARHHTTYAVIDVIKRLSYSSLDMSV